MKLIGTNLTNGQSEILYWLQAAEHLKVIDSMRVEVLSNDDFQEFSVGEIDFHFDPEQGVWHSGYMEVIHNGYMNPPDYDFFEIEFSEVGDSIGHFINKLLMKLFQERLNACFAVQCELQEMEQQNHLLKMKGGSIWDNYELPF